MPFVVPSGWETLLSTFLPGKSTRKLMRSQNKNRGNRPWGMGILPLSCLKKKKNKQMREKKIKEKQNR